MQRCRSERYGRTKVKEVPMNNRLLAVLVAGALLLSASGSTLAGGKLGGAGGADEFRRPHTELVQGGKIGGGMDGPVALGGKIGVQGGED
jgi:hypothetical protein